MQRPGKKPLKDWRSNLSRMQETSNQPSTGHKPEPTLPQVMTELSNQLKNKFMHLRCFPDLIDKYTERKWSVSNN